jgi:hypothetical protein
MARGRITKAGETSAFSISFLGHRLLTLRIGAVFGLILIVALRSCGSGPLEPRLND